MERLTERLGNKVINVKYASQHETAIHRLATIEDILGDEYDLDLVQELIQAYREGRYIILKEPEQAGVSRLRELAQADRDGRCVVLPRLETGQGDPPGEPGPPGLCPNCNDWRGLVWDKTTGGSRCTICGWTNAKT